VITIDDTVPDAAMPVENDQKKEKYEKNIA
jgi:hypothetical protein